MNVLPRGDIADEFLASALRRAQASADAVVQYSVLLQVENRSIDATWRRVYYYYCIGVSRMTHT